MKFRKSLFSLLCLSALGMSSGSAEAAAADVASWSIAKYPLYVGSASLPPLVMILMGRDHGMYYEAYNDMTDLDGDGKIDFIFNPAVAYDGLFESNYCYEYTSGVFKIAGLASAESVTYHGKDSVVYTCNHQWSGNFLNYVTTSRMDLVKRILIGGQRVVKSGTAKSMTARDGGYPYIIRQWIPHDTHVWAKAFNPADYNANGGQYCPLGHGNCTIDKWTTFNANQGLMIGNVQRRMHVMPFTCSRTDGDGNCTNGKTSSYNYNNNYPHTLGSYTMVASFSEDQAGYRQSYIDSRIFVWNWLARESGNGGGVQEVSCSGAYCQTSYTAPGGAVNTSFKVNSYNVVVESCNPTNVGIDNLSSRCKKYTQYYNTVGLLQQFSDTPSVDAYFGLITAGWNRNTSDGSSYGVLRAPVLGLYDMIDERTGDFKETDNSDRSVLSVINTLALQKEGGTLDKGNTSNNWSDCTIDSTHSKRVYQRGCQDWGNPLSQLVTLSHDYFENHLNNSVGQKKSGDETIQSRKSWTGNTPISDVNNMHSGSVTLPGLNSSLSPFSRDGIYECQKPINLILLDENISMDWKGGDTAAIAKGLDIIDASEHFSGNSYVFGENSDSDSASAIKNYQTLPTLKKIENRSSLNNVRGVSVLEPQMSGSLNGPAAAAAYYATPLKPVGLSGDKATAEYSSMQNVVVAMASFLPNFTVKAANGKSVLFIPTCKTPRTDHNANYYYTGDSTKRNMLYDDGNKYTTNCGIGDVFFVDSKYDADGYLTGVEFRVTYEDNDGGSDFDMDVAGSYKISQNADDPNVLDVELTGYFSDGYAPMTLGYVIIGTQGVKYFNHQTKQWETDEGRTVFYDITKGSSDQTRQSLLAIQSDPFYEANNITGAIDQNERLWPGSIIQTIMNNQGSSNADARKCFENNVWYFSDSGNAPMILNKNYYNGGQFAWSMLPRVGASGGGVPMYCSSTVKRKFMVTGTEGAFLPSPLELTAKYGFRNTSLSNYYYVTNAATLADNITAAMKATISAGNRSSTALTFPSAEVSSDAAETVMASFDTEYWTGEVRKVTLSGLDPDNTTSDSGISISSAVWSASNNISSMSPTDRKIYLANSAGELVPFTADAILSGNFPRLYQGLVSAFNIPSSCSDQMGDFVQRYVNYVRGDSTYELSEEEDDSLTPALTCGGTKTVLGFHKRNGKILGTVINSTPQVITNSFGRYVVFAANDGMIHVLKEDNGEEILAVIPYVGQYDMPKAALRGDITRYVLDGEFNVYSASVGGEQRYIAYGSRGLAFPGVFALDLTNLGNSEKSVKMLWELSKTEKDGVIKAYNGLGTFNSPISVFPFYIEESDRWVLLAAFGNGYNSSAADTYNPENTAETTYAADGSSSLVVVNALSGEIKKVLSDPYWGKADCNRDNDHPELYSRFKSDSGACYSNGMNVTVANYDPNHDQSPDYMYTTDLYGNVYRIRMINQDVSDWSISRIYTTVYSYQEGSNDKYQVQAVTTKPSIAGNKANKPVLIVGTGKYLTSDDVVDESMQSIYALEDPNYANESSVITPSCRGDSTSPNLTCLRTASNLPLYQMSMGALSSQDHPNFRSIILPKDNSGTALEYDSDLYAGWVIDMSLQPGERVIVNSTVQDRHVYVTTMVPTDNPCAGGGTGHMYDLNVLSGTFSKSAEESQLYSKTIMSRATTAYSRPASDGGSAGGGEGGGEGGSCTGTDCDKIRKRTGTELNCTKVHVATQTNGDGVEVLSGPKYCPRVESWQYIFE